MIFSLDRTYYLFIIIYSLDEYFLLTKQLLLMIFPLGKNCYLLIVFFGRNMGSGSKRNWLGQPDPSRKY